MGKPACKKKKYTEPADARYKCKKCGCLVKKKDKACKPEKVR